MTVNKEHFLISKNSLLTGFYLVAINYNEDQIQFNSQIRVFRIFLKNVTYSGINVFLRKENLNLVTNDFEDFAFKQFFKISEDLLYESKYDLYSKKNDFRIMEEDDLLSTITLDEFIAKLWLLTKEEKLVIIKTFENAKFSKETKNKINYIDFINFEPSVD